mgnify:FL=1
MTVAVDGRTDVEKLHELLLEPEQTHLDFKANIDLTDNKGRLNFVKDAVAMMNRPPGGYIVIGVDEDNTKENRLTISRGSLNRKLFDGSALGDIIRKYIEGEAHVIAQIHEIDNHEVVVIYLPSHRDGLPTPMSAIGQYVVNGKNKTVFQEGVVYVREGAKNEYLRHAHWGDLMAARDHRLREEARAPIDDLNRDVAKMVRAQSNGQSTNTAIALLSVDMSDAAFLEILTLHLESDNKIRIQQFIQRAKSCALRDETYTQALDKLTIIAVQSIFFDRTAIAHAAIKCLYDIYGSIGDVGLTQVRKQLDIVIRLYVIGSEAVRMSDWTTLHDLVLYPYPQPGSDSYIYSSWIRHGQVGGSRSEQVDGEKGMMIPAARMLQIEHPAMRPSMPNVSTLDPNQIADDDVLLNDLCQFDIFYCLVVYAEGKHHGGAYPASVVMNQSRADPAFVAVATNLDARKRLFPNNDDARVADVVEEVFDMARKQAMQYWKIWGRLPSVVEKFIKNARGN